MDDYCFHVILPYYCYGPFFGHLVFRYNYIIIYLVYTAKTRFIFWPIIQIIIGLQNSFSLVCNYYNFSIGTTYIRCWDNPGVIYTITIRTYKIWYFFHFRKEIYEFVNLKDQFICHNAPQGLCYNQPICTKCCGIKCVLCCIWDHFII